MYEEKTIESKEIYNGKIINLKVEKVELHNGNESYREIISHPGGCGIVAIKNNKIILVSQFRKPINQNILEIPAGKLDQYEDPIDCAKRELKEETGYSANSIKKIGQIFTSPGYTNECIHIYYTDDLTIGEMNLDQDEFVNIEEIEISEVLRMSKCGEINDGKTLAALLLAFNYLKI
ncbi:NUDIX domain-containing protein [Alkalibaculum sp. M08DMB]|uniref:NUDIX domain-containing protein n=1 Tax=Alkalibaculum sporogenes TaxID=2655001 RepID=A0A6A7K757_9FIRM|nr:NUDIX hydrolase [Alkalibaculum sporogenes]MPW25192.1 NUDIX domain-containing protein [Alkalibaculum sporogenes]